ncbi:MAG: dehydrogenase (quinone) [Bacteroidota bacterium]|jgi:putative NADPH-quinone reductase/1,4-dihydroxy-2-naphthoate octaprenyltransferase|nr:dehydrogenase (quinone) [Bacteroidota bacterium]
MNILIINGHPRKGSFSEAITNAYVSGLSNSIHSETLILADLTFNPNVIHHSPKAQFHEQDINHAKSLLTWADHVVFIYPTWWGTMPALLKGFFDRVFTEGFAFNEIEGGTGYQPLLKGKTAEAITTMDTPTWVYNLIYRAPGHNCLRRSILKFCGFHVTRIVTLATLKSSTLSQREKWLNKIETRASKIQNTALSKRQLISIKICLWLKAIRLQFYPMAIVAYCLGAWGANEAGYYFKQDLFWMGLGWIFFLEVATVLINEKADYLTDKQNRYFGPFTGGSRVIVDDLLTFSEIKRGISIALFLSFLFLTVLFVNISGNYLEILIACSSLIILALGYTAWPLKFSYRTMGELVVGITHSFSLVISGYLFMGGHLSDAFPWLLSLPLFLSILPSIILAGIPDKDADQLANKKTLTVRFGTNTSSSLAIVFTWLAVLAVTILTTFEVYTTIFSIVLYFIIPHAILLTGMLIRYKQNKDSKKRIDSLLIAALTYLMWFGIIPLINLVK